MTTILIEITGMHCQGCVRSVTGALTALPGVANVQVSLEQESASVDLDAGISGAEMIPGIEQAIRDCGFQLQAISRDETAGVASGQSEANDRTIDPDDKAVPLYSIGQLGQDARIGPSLEESPSNFPTEDRPDSPSRETARSQSPSVAGFAIKLEIEGMHCASCVSQVESALSQVGQVASAHVNLPLKQATVRTAKSASPVNVESLIDAVRRAGYSARVALDSAERVEQIELRDLAERRGWLLRGAASAVALVLLLAAGPLAWIPSYGGWFSFVIASVLQIYAGGPFFIGAFRRLSAGSANMDTLVALGTGVAFAAAVAGHFGIGERMTFAEPAMIFTFLTTGKWLESRARGQASKAIFGLMKLTSDEAKVVRKGVAESVATRDVLCGETILVEPGETAPLDAIVSDGVSHMNESWLTGESTPVPKQVGETIFAGAINLDGALQANVTRELDDTTLAQVVHLVHETQQTKTDVQRLADQVVAWFVPIVLAIAFVTTIGWSVAGDWTSGVRCAVAVLVVACPCALGLATPMAILVGSSRGARRGILVKNAQSLESGGIVDVVLLDKTGTITAGQPEVVAVGVEPGVKDDVLLQIAASVESSSRHPLAAAIARRAKLEGLETRVASELVIHEGLGIEAKLDSDRILIGAARLLAREGIEVPAAQVEQAAVHEESSKTVVWISKQDHLLGWIAIADHIPSESHEAVAELKRRGIEVVMLTGDQEKTAEAVAREVGVSRVKAELKPQDKLDFVDRLRREGRVVAMVGDGVNDGPALVAADVGLAMGAGADIAVDSADIVLVNSGLHGAVETLDLAKSTRSIVRQNLAWAFGYNVVLLPVAAGLFANVGLRLHPAMAAAAMAMSSISVVLNALRVGWRSSH